MGVKYLESPAVIAKEIFDEEELKTLAYLGSEEPDLEDLYLSNMQAGRRGIFQRLLQALIREKLIDEDTVSWPEGVATSLCIQLPSGKKLQVDVKRKHSLGRFDIEGDAVMLCDEYTRVLTHPVDLLELLRQEGMFKEATEDQFQRFKLEIQNGVANLTLALAGAARRKLELGFLAKKEGIQTSIEWVTEQKKINKNFSQLAFYEQCVVEGHPLHPGAKTKFGLTVENVIRYSPEWGAAPDIVLVAVEKEFCRTTSIDQHTVTAHLYQEYEHLQRTVEKTLHKNGLDYAHFDLIPVHPWQFDHTLYTLYKEDLEQKRIVPIPDYRIPAQSLVSFRSLAPIQDQGDRKHHIKTAVNIQTTSAIRTVSPNSVHNGPILSSILIDIQEREKQFGGSFIVLQEKAGIYFDPVKHALPEDERSTLQANLASILRENPENHVNHNEEIVMAAASVIAESPISGKLIAVELIEELAGRRNISDFPEAAALFIKRYAQVSMPGFITLMVRYGISLEGHMQNSVSVFRDGEPVRILIRDFGGVRIFPERLKKQGFKSDFYPGSSIVTEKIDEMRSILSYSVMQNHFAELISSIVRALCIEEENLWKQIVSVCKTVFAELKNDQNITEQAVTDEQALFQPMIDLKSLATMRLRGDITAYSYSKVPNPLRVTKGES